jgi:aspartate/methionine/tyrosine aminotransferase
MKLPRPFALERYLAHREFEAEHFLSASDCETTSIGELLESTGTDPGALLGHRLGYTESEGDPRLRQVVADLCACSPESVIVTNAPEEGIFLALTALVEPGDRVVVQTPCYQSLLELGRFRGARVEPWAMREGGSCWRWDLDRLADLLREPTRLLVINAPHNPTGFQPGAGELRRVVELCAERGTWLFFDQMYRGLERSPAERLPFVPDYERTVSLWGMSKTFGLPGLRIGWLAIDEPGLFEAVMGLKDYTTICSSGPGMLLARLALKVADELAARHRATIAANTLRVEEMVARRPERFTWIAPQAGPVALMRLRRDSAEKLCRTALDEAGVLLVPSSVFDLGDAHVRLGLGRRSFAAGLAAFDAWLDSAAER